MAVRKLYLVGDSVFDNFKYYICDTAADVPTSELQPGELVFVIDSGKFHKATGNTTVTEIAGGGGTGDIDGGSPTSNFDTTIDCGGV